MKKELTKRQLFFKKIVLDAIKNDIDEDLMVHFEFIGDDLFHVDVIEDYVSHVHIRGEFYDTYLNINSVYSKATKDTTDALVEFFSSFDFDNYDESDD